MAPMRIASLSHFLVKSAKTGTFVDFGRLTGGFVDVGTDQPFHRKLIRQKGWAGSLNPIAFKAPSLRASEPLRYHQGTTRMGPVTLPTERAYGLRGLLALAVLTVALLGASMQAHGQGAVRSVHGDWQIRCDTPPGAQNEQCALIQSVVAEDRSNAGLTVIVLKTADQKSRLMRVVAPLGVLLPSGLGLKLDNQDVGRAGFVRCLPNGCVAEVVMDDKLLGQLKGAKTATFIIFETPEEGIGFPLSLNGLAEGFDKLP
jgi:invasion protein IalB